MDTEESYGFWWVLRHPIKAIRGFFEIGRDES
jgi:hypothetical protein